MISHRDRIFRRKNEDPLNQHIKHSYNLYRNRITSEIKKSKRKHYKEFFEDNLNNMKNDREFSKSLVLITRQMYKLTSCVTKGSKLVQMKKWPIRLMISLQKLAPNYIKKSHSQKDLVAAKFT